MRGCRNLRNIKFGRKKNSLKGVCHEIFDLHFVHDSSMPVINSVKYFIIWFQFWQDILIFKKLIGVHCASYRRVQLCDVHYTEESDSAMCIILRSQTLRCDAHHGAMKTKYLKKTLLSLIIWSPTNGIWLAKSYLDRS